MSRLLRPVPRYAVPLVVELVERLNRCRSLLDDETDLLIRLLQPSPRPKHYRRWTPAEDRALKRAQLRHGALPALFAQLGVAPSAGYSRLRHLKRRAVK